MTYKEIFNIALPEQKRKEERWNIWVTIAVRPLSILLTIPFISSNTKPTTITKWSIASILVGFFIVCFAPTMLWKLIGWLFFFIWSILDGVDGNLARCTNQCSALGDLWDTMGGYIAMVLIYFSAGIIAFYDTNQFVFCPNEFLLIGGSATAIMSIFPRLIMHKKKSSENNSEAIKSLSDKQHFGFSQIAAMNLVSPSGFMQIIFLTSILLHFLNIFILMYFLINMGIMVVSLKKLLH